MNWDDLRYVLAVGRLHTFAAAGREMGVDPTTVGRRILAIESELDARLFDRTGDGLFPTHAGKIAIARAERIEIDTLALAREVEGSDGRPEGPVRITALDALIDYLIIPRLPQLLDRHPRLEVTFTSDFRILDLSRREADVAIRTSKPAHPDAVGRRLGRQAIAAYAARGFPLDDQPRLIGLPQALDGTLMTKMLAELFPRGRIVARCNSEGQMISLARAGVGIALIDCFAADPDPRLQRIGADPIASYDMWTVSHVDLRQTPRVRAVTEFLTAIYREEADLLAGLKPAS